jgi:hypothetical protein
VIAWHRKHFKAAGLDPLYELAGKLILGDASALGEIAADDHQIWALREEEILYRDDHGGVMPSEMDV